MPLGETEAQSETAFIVAGEEHIPGIGEGSLNMLYSEFLELGASWASSAPKTTLCLHLGWWKVSQMDGARPLKPWGGRPGILGSWYPTPCWLFDLRISPPHLRFNYMCPMGCQDIWPPLERGLLRGDSGGAPSPSSNPGAVRVMAKWEIDKEGWKEIYVLEGESRQKRERMRNQGKESDSGRERRKEGECGGKRNRAE